MLFNSLTFAVFFALVMALYWSLRSWELRKNLLLVASYIFYGAWNPPFALLLFATTALDFFLGARIAAAKAPTARKAWMITSVAVNLSMLGFFKYGNFFLQNFEWLLLHAGIAYKAPHLDIFLPIGISFYTFHSLSYTLDVYRDATKPTRSLRDFVLAVSFFPQLVAGPIVRAADFLPQCDEPTKPQTDRLRWGLFLLTLGIFEKTVLADTALSGVADKTFGFPGPLAALDAWLGVLAFSGQIYFDFAGYSLCAIGAALCLGFHLKDNFRFPYSAVGFSEFWTRWHISLSTFLRDYLYIPLGGNRVSAARMAINLVIVMFIGGLWHGAGWTFVVWGMLHGFYLVVERIFRTIFRDVPAHPAAHFVLMLLTYAAICVAWVFFRATTFASAMQLLHGMAGLNMPTNAILSGAEILRVLIVVGGMIIAHWSMRHSSLEELFQRVPRAGLAAIWVVLVSFIVLNQGNGNAFIYFQF
jgi:alginate O-acetyltransferase complex protein AlgI